jgi:hypothetical protein
MVQDIHYIETRLTEGKNIRIKVAPNEETILIKEYLTDNLWSGVNTEEKSRLIKQWREGKLNPVTFLGFDGLKQ